MKETYDLIVVGGGASGMMAAGRAAERGLRVLLLEKNSRLGEKLRISGGGRCNITNAEEDQKILLGKYGKAEKYLYSLFTQFGMAETFAFFESRGLPLKIEANKRAFPQSEKAEDVVKVLETYVEQSGVTVLYGSVVTRVEKNVEQETGHISSLWCGDTAYTAKEYIFATGSVSHPETGSTGDGFAWLEKLGHTVAKPTPTIVPLSVKEKWIKALMGVTFADVKISFFTDGKKQFNTKGNILCTHFGLSGPTILNVAHRVAEMLPTGTVTAEIDAFPGQDLGSLEKDLIVLFDDNKNKELKNILKDCIPPGTSKGMAILLGAKIDLAKKVHSITKEERKYIVQTLKALPVTITGLMGFDRAVIADGGIALAEIDFKTMRSKKIANLLVTGDLLHINRPSGGFSLQLCWSTGYVAGSSVGELGRSSLGSEV
jgi:predicted Rossmann fold flavoprotein